MPGDYNHDLEAPYFEKIAIVTPRVTLQSDPGAIIEGTIHVNAPGVTLRALTVVGMDACIVLGPGASDCRIEMCRIVTSAEDGIAIDVVGPRAPNVNIVNSTIYTPGGHHPDTDSRGLKHNWKRFERSGVGIRIEGDASNAGAWIHHNRIAGYSTALEFGNPAAELSGIRLWKNRVTANTTGLRLFGVDSLVEDNEFSRNTGIGVEIHGRGNRLAANRIMGNTGSGAIVSGTDVVNNVVRGNRGGAIQTIASARVIHNTFHTNGGYLLTVAVLNYAEPRGVVFINNLVDHDGPLFQNDVPDARRHNVYANHAVPSQLGKGSRFGPVSFRDVARRDYRPDVHSVAVDAGVVLTPDEGFPARDMMGGAGSSAHRLTPVRKRWDPWMPPVKQFGSLPTAAMT